MSSLIARAVSTSSGAGTRAGVRSRDEFAGEQFSVEARVAKVGPAYPEPNQKGEPIGFASLTILFDGSGRNRVEWVLTSEQTLEAWAVVDGRGIHARLDRLERLSGG